MILRWLLSVVERADLKAKHGFAEAITGIPLDDESDIELSDDDTRTVVNAAHRARWAWVLPSFLLWATSPVDMFNIWRDEEKTVASDVYLPFHILRVQRTFTLVGSGLPILMAMVVGIFCLIGLVVQSSAWGRAVAVTGLMFVIAAYLFFVTQALKWLPRKSQRVQLLAVLVLVVVLFMSLVWIGG